MASLTTEHCVTVSLTTKQRLVARGVVGLVTGAAALLFLWIIVSPNCPNWISTVCGAWFIGATATKGALSSFKD